MSRGSGDTFWRDSYWLNWRAKLAIALIILAIIGGIVWGGIAWSTWWERHKSDRGRGDTGVTSVDRTLAHTIEMPDTFGNVATKCYVDPQGSRTGQRLWTTTKGGIWITEDAGCAS